jgi:2,3-bisphosphoglycerate-independent phosphoglycerate mutase
MKYILVVIDGAADYPVELLKGKTPLEAANTPNMDQLARKGMLGRVKTVPRGFVPSSDVANLAILGYDPNKYYCGRGPLEAANLGVTLGPNDVAFRCNLVTVSEGKMLDYSCGHIIDKESSLIMKDINKELGGDGLEFIPGISYRNLLVYRDAKKLNFDKLRYNAPHDIMGQEITKNLPKGKNSDKLIALMRKSQEFLANHDINKVRIDLGENPANMIWLWGCGHTPQMPAFEEKFGVKGAVISAVDLINGIGRIVGMKILHATGVTGYYDTNYKGKAQAALKALDDVDFAFIHIEAPDEAGHNGDLRMKMTCLERIDKLVVGTILEAMRGKDFRILISPDHPTPVALRTHTNEPVPFVMFGKGITQGDFKGYNEIEAQNSPVYFEKGHELLNQFIHGK